MNWFEIGVHGGQDFCLNENEFLQIRQILKSEKHVVIRKTLPVVTFTTTGFILKDVEISLDVWRVPAENRYGFYDMVGQEVDGIETPQIQHEFRQRYRLQQIKDRGEMEKYNALARGELS